MEEAVLEIVVTDTVVVSDFRARRRERRQKAIRSPFYRPVFDIRMEDDLLHATGHPRGPTILIDMDLMGAAPTW